MNTQKQNSRFGIYFSAKPPGWISVVSDSFNHKTGETEKVITFKEKPKGWCILDICFNDKSLVIPLPFKKPFLWARGFVFAHGNFWKFDGNQSTLFKPFNP